MQKGDNVSIGTLTGNTNMIAGHFAAWELGLIPFILNNQILSGDTDFYIRALKFIMHMQDEHCDPSMRINVVHDFHKPIDPNNSGGLTRMDLKDGLYAEVVNL